MVERWIVIVPARSTACRGKGAAVMARRRVAGDGAVGDREGSIELAGEIPPPRLAVVLPEIVELEIVTGAPMLYKNTPPPLPEVAVLLSIDELAMTTGLVVFLANTPTPLDELFPVSVDPLIVRGPLPKAYTAPPPEPPVLPVIVQFCIDSPAPPLTVPTTPLVGLLALITRLLSVTFSPLLTITEPRPAPIRP